MGRYTIRRFLQFLPVLFGTTFFIYWLVWSIPGDPFAGKCGPRVCEQTQIDYLRDQYNLNDPLLVQYGKFMWNMVTFNLGDDFSGFSISESLATAFPISLRLALIAIVIETVAGIAAGVLTGLKRGGFLDNFVLISTIFLISLPIFVIGYIAQYIFNVKLGIISATVTPDDVRWGELIVPGFVLASIQMAYVTRLTRTSIAENSTADYVRTAKAKGLKPRRVVGVHLLRNSLIPVITFLGAELGTLMGGAVVTESVFNIPGVGGLLFSAVHGREAAIVVPIVTLLVMGYLIVNLVVDLAYAVIDPRIRYE